MVGLIPSSAPRFCVISLSSPRSPPHLVSQSFSYPQVVVNSPDLIIISSSFPPLQMGDFTVAMQKQQILRNPYVSNAEYPGPQ